MGAGLFAPESCRAPRGEELPRELIDDRFNVRT
jgi:hypothetical protein